MAGRAIISPEQIKHTLEYFLSTQYIKQEKCLQPILLSSIYFLFQFLKLTLILLECYQPMTTNRVPTLLTCNDPSKFNLNHPCNNNATISCALFSLYSFPYSPPYSKFHNLLNISSILSAKTPKKTPTSHKSLSLSKHR